jgi:hypothetical protein
LELLLKMQANQEGENLTGGFFHKKTAEAMTKAGQRSPLQVGGLVQLEESWGVQNIEPRWGW